MRFTVGLLAVVCFFACSKGQPDSAGPGGPKACTEIGCANGLRIALEKATAWEAGNYSFVFDVDGAAVTCTGALPLKACEAGLSLTCEPAGKVQVGESGCAMGPETHGFSDVQIEGAPRTVTLKISKDEQPVHAATLTPTYATSRPNGEGCEPVCNGASERVALP